MSILLYTYLVYVGTSAKNTFEVYCCLMAADGNWHSFIKGLEGEKLHETYTKLWMYTNLPNFIRPTLAGVCTYRYPLYLKRLDTRTQRSFA